MPMLLHLSVIPNLKYLPLQVILKFLAYKQFVRVFMIYLPSKFPIPYHNE